MSYKTKAYKKTENGYELVTRKYISSLNDTEKTIFIDTHKPFFLTPEDDGLHLTFNKRQKTFRFYPNFEHRYLGSNEESATHKYCVEEISKLKELPLKLKKDKKTITLTFNYSFSEIVLPIGDHYIKPDLLLYIREPNELALKWNIIVALEIVVSHDLDGKKLQLYKEYKIPVIRIKANKKWGRKKEDEMSPAKKIELRNWIKNTFKKGYTADLLLDPKSKDYLENATIENLESKIEQITTQKKKVTTDLKKIDKLSVNLKKRNRNLFSKVENYSAENRKLLGKISENETKIYHLKNNLEEQIKIKIKFQKLFLATIILLILITIIGFKYYSK